VILPQTRDVMEVSWIMNFSLLLTMVVLTTSADYPYKAQDGVCDTNRNISHVVTIDGYEYVPTNDEKSLKKVATSQCGH
jgi:hypothetical protein